MPKITFVSQDTLNITLDARVGQTILDVALEHQIPLDHNCGGSCACTTCHVMVREGMQNLSEMEEDEEDRLDTAEGLTLTSRLGCQARIMGREDRGDLVVEIPKRTQPFRSAEQH